MKRMSRALQAVAPNLVPAGGWFLAGWEPSTALIVYWSENVIAALAIAARILLHRRATRKRGHEGDFFSGFLTTALAFSLAHGVFLAFIIFGLMSETVNRDQIASGLRWMLIAQLVTLAVDLLFLGSWPFREIKVRTDWILGRVMVVQMAILFGMFFSVGSTRPTGIFGVFIGLKTLVDVGTLLPRWEPRDPPRWMASLANRFPAKKGQESFDAHWRKARQSEIAKRDRDEQVLPALE